MVIKSLAALGCHKTIYRSDDSITRVLTGLTLGPTNPRPTNVVGETLDIRRSEFSSESRYSCRHSHSRKLHPDLTEGLHCRRDAPLPPANGGALSSAPTLASIDFRRKIPRLVSCYAFFEGWLLLSQPPRCLRNFTSFHT